VLYYENVQIVVVDGVVVVAVVDGVG